MPANTPSPATPLARDTPRHTLARHSATHALGRNLHVHVPVYSCDVWSIHTTVRLAFKPQGTLPC